MTSLATFTRRSGLFDASLAERLGLQTLAMPPTGSVFDIQKAENGYVVRTEVPGFAPDQIAITVKDATLSIVAENDTRSVKRSIVLGDEIDTENIVAKLEHGVLSLSLTRHPETEPKRIAVQ